LLLGTTTWTPSDAARFAYALGAAKFGRAISQELLRLMRKPKRRSEEATPIDYTASLSWGAEDAFRGTQPAYKSGWGGTQQGRFLVGQITVVRLPDQSPLGISVMFRPDVQPVRDDPGLTQGPVAITEALRPLARGLPSALSE
jgi:hypothetical protein